MKKFSVKKPVDLKNHIGDDLALSDWLCVTQEMIDLFAKSTGDHQWIHLDEERAKRETPFKVNDSARLFNVIASIEIPQRYD
jgi:acyl dehydratase